MTLDELAALPSGIEPPECVITVGGKELGTWQPTDEHGHGPVIVFNREMTNDEAMSAINAAGFSFL